jgi:hypothetical protein
MSVPFELTVQDREESVEARSRFGPVSYLGQAWDLSHLAPFGVRAEIASSLGPCAVDVVVFFTCHCFTTSDVPAGTLASDYYRDDKESRVLCKDRNLLSKRFLPRLVQEPPKRQIRTVGSEPNFLTFELLGEGEPSGVYTVFFTVKKDVNRKKRVLLRVQIAYRVESLTGRQQEAGKVNFSVLLRTAYEGRKIKG